MVIVIAGPTASGKSAVALALARALGGTIINADASQLYADLRIITARPTPEEEAAAPHRLYGVLDGDDTASAARWAAMARAEIVAAEAAGRLPILVGGTGMYLRSLIDGLAPVPPIDAGVRAAVRELSPGAVHAALEREEPGAAARLAPADQQRTRRALEVVRSTGRPLSAWQQQRHGRLEADVRGVVMTMPRPQLYARCEARFDAMLAAGAMEEVAALMARRLPADRPVLKAVGVPPLAACLAGDLPLAEAVARAKQDTRHYAKRQTTWFGNQHSGWARLEAGAPMAALLAAIGVGKAAGASAI
jgi:tRNA dimethylallyltransferase